MEYDQFVYGTHIVRVEDGVPVTYTHVDGGMIDSAATGVVAYPPSQLSAPSESFVPSGSL